MKSKSILFRITIFIVVLLFAVLFLIMFINTNNKYKQNETKIYNQGELFSLSNNIECKVTKNEFFNVDKINNWIKLKKIIDNEDIYGMSMITLNLQNTSKNKEEVDLCSLCLESVNYSTQFDADLYDFFNDIDMEFTLDSGESATVKLPTVISQYSFFNCDRDDVFNRNFYLVTSLYPVKNMVQVNISDK